MRPLPIALSLSLLALAACNDSSTQQANQRTIRVTSAEQQQLHQLDAINLAIGLKRAIYDAGYTCKRVTDAGFVGIWKNNDMWMAHCVYDNGAKRDWAIFAGPDGSAQVRDCADIKAGNRQLSAAEAIPNCVIKQRPKGSFTELK
jgi:hypothetical protein